MQLIARIVLAATAIAAATGASDAQTRRNPAAPPPPSRDGMRYSQPPGQTGTVGWNTPNASGNFGGPGTGGGSGGGP